MSKKLKPAVPHLKAAAAGLFMALSLSACGAPSLSAPLAAAPPRPVQAQRVQAQLEGSPPVRLQIKQAEIAVSTAELNTQLKAILKLSNEQRLRNPVLSADGEGLQLVGKVKAARFLPEVSFSVQGTLSALPGNIIRFSPQDIRVVGIPVKQLMDVIGLELANLAKFKDRWGRVVQSGNDIDLIIEKFTSDAIIEGQIKEVRPESSGITVFF